MVEMTFSYVTWCTTSFVKKFSSHTAAFTEDPICGWAFMQIFQGNLSQHWSTQSSKKPSTGIGQVLSFSITRASRAQGSNKKRSH
jgi:hypothetical protein